MTPTQTAYYNAQRSIRDLEARGYVAANVEKWMPFQSRRQDLFGFADVIAFKESHAEILLVQTTTKSNMSARKKKILANDTAKKWLAAGHHIEIQGWYQVGRYWHCDYITL